MELRQEGTVNDAVYEELRKVKPSSQRTMLREKDGIYHYTSLACDSYICSFSRNSDSLPMWNYYSKESGYEGFNIGLYVRDLNDSPYNTLNQEQIAWDVYPVIYSKETQKELVKKFLLEILSFDFREHREDMVQIISMQLLSWKLVFKSDYFKHEEEVRLVVDISKSVLVPHTDMEEAKTLDVQYRITHGYCIPYVSIPIERKCLESVCQGPLSCPETHKEKQKETIGKMLKSNGYDGVEISFSKVPIRY